MLRVGLTGGIGAGKSEVSRRLAARGATIIDADLVAREVVVPGSAGLAALTAEFGSGYLLPSGELDRPKLGELVFADPERLGRLNAIMFPLIAARMAGLEAAAARAAGPAAIVVHDVALLAERGLGAGYDVVVVVDAPMAVQLSRLTGHRQMSREQAKARIAAQATREQRLAIADIVVDNSGSLEDLDARVAEVWTELLNRAAGSGSARAD